MKKPELLAPAGDLEKLKMALAYGADAVYIGGEQFGLRTASKNFTEQEMREGLDFAHARGKKVYVTCNIIAHNEDLPKAAPYFAHLQALGVDALIIADPGFLQIARQTVPSMEIHLSTQANTTNSASANFWHQMGVKRIVTARELSLKEIQDVIKKTPDTLEFEVFVHGAMCMSYSGRCLISNFMTGRDANQGECAQPCRWNYALVEKTRPGEYFPVQEDERGTYFFNSKDLCLIEHLPALIEAGVASLKIEGRVKTSYYVATVVRAYRLAIDAYLADPKNYHFETAWQEELQKVSHRDFTTAFFEHRADASAQNYGSSAYIRGYDFIGLIQSYESSQKIAWMQVKNKVREGDEVEIIQPGVKEVLRMRIEKLCDETSQAISSATIAGKSISFESRQPLLAQSIVRKKNS